jgi:Sec-independent protein translocase protein TatA
MSIGLAILIIVVLVVLVLVFGRSRWRLTRRRWWQRR